MKKIKLFLLTSLALTFFSSCEKDPIQPDPTPQGGVLQGTLTQNTNIPAGSTWTLKGYVYVPDGITLTVGEGATIKSDVAEKGALCIERGGVS